MITILEKDWRGGLDAAGNHIATDVIFNCCRPKKTSLSGYKIDELGYVSPGMRCEHCGTWQGEIKLDGYPWRIDERDIQ